MAIAQGGPVTNSEPQIEAIDADEALRGENSRYEALIANDFTAMEELFAEDLIVVHSSAHVDGKAAYIESMRSGGVKYRSMHSSEVRVRTSGSIGIITGRGDFDVDNRGQEDAVVNRFTSIWVKQGGKVQWLSWHSSRIVG
jgi:ketosteroid isomerase-like protein